MAQSLIFTINLLQAASPYQIGDKFNTYWDDGTNDFVVTVDQNVETFGSNVATLMDSGTFEANAATWGLIVDDYPLPAWLTRSNAIAHSGTYSARYTHPVGTNPNPVGILGYQSFTMSVGKTYRVSCWVYSTAANQLAEDTAVLSLRPNSEFADSVLSFNNQTNCTLLDCASTWKQISVDVTVITNTTSTEPLIQLFISQYTSLITGKYINYDDFQVKEITGFTTSTSTITSGPDLGNIVRRAEAWHVSNAKPYTIASDTGTNTSKIFSLNSFCTGVDLTTFYLITNNPPFPYAGREITKNSPSCGYVDPCDIHVVGVTTVTKASNPFALDGTASFKAISSKSSVKYSLNDVEGSYDAYTNTTGSFTGLGVGHYLLYARDSSNCTTGVEVVIGSEITNEPPPVIPGNTNIPIEENIVNSEKYRMEHKDLFNGVTARVDILERGFTGSVTEVKGGMPPFLRTLPNISVNNKFEPLRPTSATLNLLSERDLQFIGLFSQDDRKFQVKYYKPVGTLLWTGFIVPSVMQQPYTTCPPYVTTVSATDNLTQLSTLDFLDKDGNKLSGNSSLISIIALILRKLSLGINIRVACNIKEETHTTNASAALEETYIDMACFYEDDGTPWSCDRVLKMIIPFGAKIVQDLGVWNIVRVEEQTSSYNYRQYTKDGVFSSSGSYDPTINIESPSVRLNAIFANYDANLEIVPAYGKITVRRKLHAVKNLITNGSFDIDQFVNNLVNGWTISYIGINFKWTIEKIIEKFSVTRGTQSQSTSSSSDIVRSSQINNNNSFLSSILSSFKSGNGGINVLSKGSYALSMSGLDNSDGSSNNNFGIVTSKAFPIQFGSNDSFTFSFNYRVNLSQSIRTHTDPLFTRIGYKIKIGNYYYNSREGWTTDSNKDYNYLYVDKFGEDVNFEITINFPPTIHGVVNLFQCEFKFYGSGYAEFNVDPISAGLATINSPVGRKYLGTISGIYYYYTLISGTEATSAPDIYRPTDYGTTDSDGNPNNVYLKLDKTASKIQPTQNIYLDEVTLIFNPNAEKAPIEEVFTQIINTNFKENLEVEIETGDLPKASATLREIHNKQYIYDNYFKDYSGQPTGSWTRTSSPGESNTVQQIFLKSLVTQYQYPTFKVSGSFIGFSELNFLTTFKHEEVQLVTTLTNEDFTGSLTGWTDTSVSWSYNANKARLSGITGGSSSSILYQTATFESGQRIRVEFSIARSSSSGVRDDWFYIVMRNGSDTVQQVVGSTMSGDGTWTRSIKFTISQACTAIGFYVRCLNGSGTCTYDLDYFRLNGLIVTRYFTVDSMEIDGKNNLYNASLMQLVPVIPSTDPNVDDSGEGNTGTEGGAGGGTNGSGSGVGSSFSGDFNGDFGSDYDTIYN